MSKFDRYGEQPKQLPGRGGASLPGTASAADRLLAAARATPRASDAADRILSTHPAKVAIALDATGSMSVLIASAKASIGEIVRRATAGAGRPIAIELFAYRDYDVPDRLLDRSGVADAPDPLIKWLSRVTATGGGGNDGEAVEAALQAIADAGDFTTVLLAGDEPSNSRAGLNAAGKRQAASAHDLARSLGERQVPVHCFVIDQHPRTIADFAEIARLSGGRSGRLDGSAEMIDLAVMAILSAVKGRAAVGTYMGERRLSANARAFGTLLLDAPK